MTMWTLKLFKSAKACREWINANRCRFQIEEVAVNNAWGVQYRKLRRVC